MTLDQLALWSDYVELNVNRTDDGRVVFDLQFYDKVKLRHRQLFGSTADEVLMKAERILSGELDEPEAQQS